MGVRPEAVRRIEQRLHEVLLWPSDSPGATYDQLEYLLQLLRDDLTALEGEGRDAAMIQRLSGVLEALAGGLLVSGNALIGAGAAPATAGISLAGAALSTAAGTDLVGRGVEKAIEA
jgi:hypothetical protein